MTNEEKRILWSTNKEEEHHFSLIHVSEAIEEGACEPSLLSCHNEGERRRRHPSFP